jgi:hypothetical protein
MKSLNMKLALSAFAIALLATPALAARSHQQASQQPNYFDQANQGGQVFTYPNGAERTGTIASRQSGAEFNLLRQPSID